MDTHTKFEKLYEEKFEGLDFGSATIISYCQEVVESCVLVGQHLFRYCSSDTVAQNGAGFAKATTATKDTTTCSQLGNMIRLQIYKG